MWSVHGVLLIPFIISLVGLSDCQETIITLQSDVTQQKVTNVAQDFIVRHAEIDNSDSSKILIAIGKEAHGHPAEIGVIETTDYNYTSLYGDVTSGNQNQADGTGQNANIVELRGFDQNADGTILFFADRFAIRQVDRSNGNVTTILGDPADGRDNLTAATFGNIQGLVYDESRNALWINMLEKGLVAFDLTNQVLTQKVPKANFSDGGGGSGQALAFSSNGEWLYMKVKDGINRYNMSTISDLANDELTGPADGRWISKTDGTAINSTTITISSKAGSLGLSPNGRVLTLTDQDSLELSFFDTESGESAQICTFTGQPADGNSSACVLGETTAATWAADGTLYIFSRYGAIRDPLDIYISVSSIQDYGPNNAPPPTTTTAEPTTTTTTAEPTTSTTESPTTTTAGAVSTQSGAANSGANGQSTQAGGGNNSNGSSTNSNGATNAPLNATEAADASTTAGSNNSTIYSITQPSQDSGNSTQATVPGNAVNNTNQIVNNTTPSITPNVVTTGGWTETDTIVTASVTSVGTVAVVGVVFGALKATGAGPFAKAAGTAVQPIGP